MSSDGERLTEIDVERINVRERDGRLRMVISGRDRAPDPVVDGRVGARQGGNSAGVISYNERGDECGGLIFGGNDGHAGAILTFDRFRQDQVVGLIYNEADGTYKAGLSVWDRPAVPVNELFERYAAFERLRGEERAAVLAQMRADGVASATRVFAGRERDGSATVSLCDAEQRERLRLVVEAKGAARIEFLDEEGQVVKTLG
jgi:hypothetical protein